MKGAIFLYTLLAWSTSLFAQTVKPNAITRPNIILILSDDAGYADFSFQSSRLIPTPHIDRIAAEGAKFTNGYVTGAVCCPSRAGLLTGVNQAEFGQVYNYVQGVQYNIPKDSFGIPLNQKLVGDYLKQLGYATGIVGKWHEGFSHPFHPNQRGFDYFWGFLWGSSPYFTGLAKMVEHNGNTVPADSIPYMTDAIGEKSMQFIEANAQQPFFLYVSFNAPHTPMQAKPELLAQYKTRFNSEGRALNAAMTHSLDENVGKILGKLEELHLLENTIVIFTNDNGGQVTHSFADNYPLRGMKSDVYEGGIRVPMAAMWKSHIKAGTVFYKPVTTLDFLPTFLKAAGARPESYRQLQGKDLVEQITNPQKNSSNRPLYWYVAKNKGALRLGDYKMVFLPGKQPELYDLANDIGETKNLYESKPDIAQTLHTLYKDWESKLPPPIWIPAGKAKPGSED